jgi:hypothetical protein
VLVASSEANPSHAHAPPHTNPALQTATPRRITKARRHDAVLFPPSTYAHDSTAPAFARRLGFRGQPGDAAAETEPSTAGDLFDFCSFTGFGEEPEDTRRQEIGGFKTKSGYTAKSGLFAAIWGLYAPITGLKALCRLVRLALCWPAACAKLLAPGHCARCDTESGSYWTPTATTLAGLL